MLGKFSPITLQTTPSYGRLVATFPVVDATPEWKLLSGGPRQPCMELRELQLNHPRVTLDDCHKYDVKRFHNCQLHNPWDRLPIEIRYMIFKEYFDIEKPTNMPKQLIIMAVCRHWKSDIYNNPRFWTRLQIPPVPLMADPTFFLKQIRSWLRLSEKLPIALNFTPRSSGWAYHTMQSVNFQSAQLVIKEVLMSNRRRILALNTVDFYPIISDPDLCGSPKFWPVLTHISMWAIGVDEAFCMLRLSPRATCVQFVDLHVGPRPLIPDLLDHQYIVSLSVGFDRTTDPAAFFCYLKASRLKNFICKSKASGPMTLTILKGFCRRSKFSLNALHLQCTRLNRPLLVWLLRKQPELRTLSITLHPLSFHDDPLLTASYEAVEAVMRLLHTATNGSEGSTREFTTNSFLPCLEALQYTGRTTYSSTTFDQVCAAHEDIPDSERQNKVYRPLRLLKFTLQEEHLGGMEYIVIRRFVLPRLPEPGESLACHSVECNFDIDTLLTPTSFFQASDRLLSTL